MAFLDRIRRLRPGRRAHAPARDTQAFPNLMQVGQRIAPHQPAYKPTPRNLRYFSKTPYARRAINAIKNPIAQLDWEIVPRRGVAGNPLLESQAETVRRALEWPNEDDSFRTLVEQVVEDIMLGAGAIEQQTGGDPDRPLWLWPVDGQSIQIFPGWAGNADEARYMQTLGYGSIGGTQQGVLLRNDELIYLRPNPSTANPFGLGPLEVAFQSVSRALGVGDYAGNLAANAAPNVILFLGKGADEKAITAFRSYWQTEIEGQGKMPILGGSEAPQALRLFPDGDSALYLQWQEFLKSEIAVSFDLSPQNLGVERDVNRNTAEVAADRDRQQVIRPWADLLAAHLTREAIQGRLGFSQLEFRFLGLDNEDELQQAAVFEKEYANNAITPNEYRTRRGRPPLASQWGDLTAADVSIAQAAARGTQVVDDRALDTSGRR